MAEMTLKCLDGLTIDPETCPIDELERVHALAKREEDYWNTMQLSAKTFINSVYGVFGSEYFNLANIDIAESITLQGQDLIKYSVVKINDYFHKQWHLDYEGHKRVSKIMKEEYGFDDFDSGSFEKLVQQPLQFETLQVYGDSIVGDSLILTDNGLVRIDEMFNEGYGEDPDKYLPGFSEGDKVRVRSDRFVYCLSDGDLQSRKVAYVMRHKCGKKIYRIVSEDGKFVDVTSDHSIMVVRDNVIMEVCPNDIHIDDKLIVVDNPEKGCVLNSIVSKDLSPYSGKENYVYDIAVEGENELEHTFFANGICVHNTDSVSGDTIVRTKKHVDGIKISELYNENSGNEITYLNDNHESVGTNDKILNFDNELYAADIERIIRHKVTKDKYRLKLEDGKSVDCTEDHSLVVLRNVEGECKQVVVKPFEIKDGDMFVYIDVLEDGFGQGFQEGKCEKIGIYEDEYVYDIEVNDFTHTFFANDILVHNSAYITLEELIKMYHIPQHQQIKFCLAVYKAVMAEFLEKAFDDYAAAFHCKQNLEKFELEKISRSIIMLAKKNYMCDVAWIDSGIFFEPGHHITYTGFDVVKGSTTNFCRDEMKKFTSFCFEKINKGSIPTQGECVQFLKECKRRFSMQSPNEIGKTVSISEYEKYVKSDNRKEIEYFNYSADGSRKGATPIHVRAAATYNNILLNKKREYLSKYELLKSGDKVRFYYTSPDDVFGFLPDKFPYEFAPKVDIDIQFEKSLLSPINRIIVAMGLDEVPPSLTYSVGLF